MFSDAVMTVTGEGLHEVVDEFLELRDELRGLRELRELDEGSDERAEGLSGSVWLSSALEPSGNSGNS